MTVRPTDLHYGYRIVAMRKGYCEYVLAIDVQMSGINQCQAFVAPWSSAKLFFSLMLMLLSIEPRVAVVVKRTGPKLKEVRSHLLERLVCHAE